MKKNNIWIGSVSDIFWEIILISTTNNGASELETHYKGYTAPMCYLWQKCVTDFKMYKYLFPKNLKKCSFSKVSSHNSHKEEIFIIKEEGKIMHLMIFNWSFVANHFPNQQSLYLWEKCKSESQSDISTCYKNDSVLRERWQVLFMM